MKVYQGMHKRIDYVTTTAKVRDVAKIIFGHHINGVSVVNNKGNLVGIVTNGDIFKKLVGKRVK